MKKIIILVMVLVLAFSFAACGSRQADQSDLTKEPSVSSEEGTVVLPEDFVVPTIEQTELANEKGIIITAKELIYDPSEGWGLTVTMENHSENNIAVQTEELAVNHHEISHAGMMDMDVFDVEAGQSLTGTFHFGYDSFFRHQTFEFLHMTSITDIEISFYILKTFQAPGDPRVYNEEFFTSDVVELHTSEYANGPQTASISGGVEIYNESGLRIVAKCIESDKSEYALETMIFIDNQSEESFYIKVDDLQVNNMLPVVGMQCGVNPNRTAISCAYYTDNDLQEVGIVSPITSASMGILIQKEFLGDILQEIPPHEVPIESE